MIETITDPDDSRLDDFRDLSDADVRPDRRGVVIAEGTSVVERLLGSPYPVRAVVGVETKLRALAPVLAAAGAPSFLIDKWVLSQAVGFRVTRGVLASADRLPPADAAELLDSARRVVVLEQLNDFENLGALFRNAAAFGVDAVLLDPRTADPLYRRSVRVSMGHVLRVPFARLPEPWPTSLNLLQDQGFRVLAMTPRPSAQALRSVPVPPRWALLVGAEGDGLTDAALSTADEQVRIPMAAGVDSLNVATAAAVALAHLTLVTATRYELFDLRRVGMRVLPNDFGDDAGMSADLEILDNPDDDRYEVRLDGQVIGRADYQLDGDRVVIPHAQIDPAHGGQGLGGRLVRYALDDIRRRGLKVVPACPFVADYLTKHPEYADLL